MSATGYQGILIPDASVVIAASSASSAALNCNGFTLVGFILPAAFTGTALTFQVSSTLAGTYSALCDKSGSPISFTVAQGNAYCVDPIDLQGFQFIKLVSGSTEGSARTIICSLKGQ